jgi:hypothetical protein
MKRKLSVLILMFVPCMVFVGGCATPTPESATPIVTTASKVTAVPPTPTPEPTNTAQPTRATARDAAYEGISFSYDTSLANGVIIETVPPLELFDGDGGTLPERIEFSFEGYILADSSHKPYVQVYPLDDLDPDVDHAWTVVEQLKQLLQDRPERVPEGASGLPVLPLLGARQMMNAQIEYVDFVNGRGVRFLTQYAHGPADVPIHNRGMVYSFQGTTADGLYHVAALLPVSHPTLPATAADIAGDSYRNDFPVYVSRTEEQLNAQEDSSFLPHLALLDAMMASLAVHPTSLPSTDGPEISEGGFRALASWTEGCFTKSNAR